MRLGSLYIVEISCNLILRQYFSCQIMYSHGKILSSPFDSSSKKKRRQGDRFIPNSVTKNLYSLFEEAASEPKSKSHTYTNLLGEQLFPITSGKILNFGEDIKDKENACNNLAEHESKNRKRAPIKKKPYKILEAPLLKDDFYLNLVDWSDSNHIGVGLQSSLFLWSGSLSKVDRLYESENPMDYICSVNFVRHSPKIAAGFTDGQVRIFDIMKSKPCQSFEGIHHGRIGSLGCTNNLVCTGGRDGIVSVQDIRSDREVIRYRAHNQEICGLKISPDGLMIASGGNDNKLFLFSLKTMSKMAVWDDHKAAVKAIGFNPRHPSIASGGGTADRKIRIFSLQTLEMQNSVDTGSQICNLMYSPISNELVTTHGYSLNQMNIWKWETDGDLTKIDCLMGHKNRVLYLAGESQGSKIVTGAGDEELRLWKIFDETEKHVNYDLR